MTITTPNTSANSTSTPAAAVPGSTAAAAPPKMSFSSIVSAGTTPAPSKPANNGNGSNNAANKTQQQQPQKPQQPKKTEEPNKPPQPSQQQQQARKSFTLGSGKKSGASSSESVNEAVLNASPSKPIPVQAPAPSVPAPAVVAPSAPAVVVSVPSAKVEEPAAPVVASNDMQVEAQQPPQSAQPYHYQHQHHPGNYYYSQQPQPYYPQYNHQYYNRGPQAFYPMPPVYGAPFIPGSGAPFIPGGATNVPLGAMLAAPAAVNAAAPPGLASTTNSAVNTTASGQPVALPFFVPQRKSAAIKIVNPDTLAEVHLTPKAAAAAPLMTTVSSTSSTQVVDATAKLTVKTPAGQTVDLAAHKKDAGAREVASLEGALSAMTISKDDDVVMAKVEEEAEAMRQMEFSSEDDGSESEGESDEEDVSGADYILQRGQSLSYPSGIIPFTPIEEDGGMWKYSKAFLMQFQAHCSEGNAAIRAILQDRFKQGATRRSKASRGGDRHGRAEIRLHRTENAWKPAAGQADPTEKLTRDLRGILNRLTMEKFELLSDEILALGILKPNNRAVGADGQEVDLTTTVILPAVINVLFGKAVDEPQFCPMYARLAMKIVQRESAQHNAAQKAAGEALKPVSDFRRLLVTRCQREYENKRAWSAKRIEKARALMEGRDEQTVAPIKERAKEDIGHLTDEDLMMIRLKRQVLGNVRFIGELFRVGLLSSRIMHACVEELLANVENPEEEEVESLCRLLTTVGKLIDLPDETFESKKSPFPAYITRMKYLASAKAGLSSRIRFMVMDVLELRERKWTAAAPVVNSAPNAANTAAERERRARAGPATTQPQPPRGDFRGGEGGYRGASNTSAPSTANAAPASVNHPKKSFATKTASEHAAPNAWTTSPSMSSSKAPPSPQLHILTRPETSNAGPKNRFGALHGQEEPVIAAPQEVRVDDEASVKKMLAVADEYFRSGTVEDLLEEFTSLHAHGPALARLIEHAMERGGKKDVYALRPFIAKLPSPQVSSLVEGAHIAFGMLDDLVVDVPSAIEYAGYVMAAIADATGKIDAALSLPAELLERDSLVVLKAYAWALHFASTPKDVPLTRRLFAMIDAGDVQAVDAVKKILKERVPVLLPELALKIFDGALKEFSRKAASITDPIELANSLAAIVEPAARANPPHVSLIVQKALLALFPSSNVDWAAIRALAIQPYTACPLDPAHSHKLLDSLFKGNPATLQANLKGMHASHILSSLALVSFARHPESGKLISSGLKEWIGTLDASETDVSTSR